MFVKLTYFTCFAAQKLKMQHQIQIKGLASHKYTLFKIKKAMLKIWKAFFSKNKHVYPREMSPAVVVSEVV